MWLGVFLVVTGPMGKKNSLPGGNENLPGL